MTERLAISCAIAALMFLAAWRAHRRLGVRYPRGHDFQTTNALRDATVLLAALALALAGTEGVVWFVARVTAEGG